MNNYSADFDINTFLKSLGKLTDYFQIKICLINEKFAFLQFKVDHPDFVDNKYFKSLCLAEKRLDLTEEVERKRKEELAKNSPLSFAVDFNQRDFNQQNPEIDRSEEAISAFLFSTLSSMDKKKMNYFFLNDDDPTIFVKSTAVYFISGRFTLPRMVMQKHCKTKLCIALRSIYRYYKENVPLNEHSSFIKFLKILPAFENKTNSQIVKSLTRECG